MPVSQNKLASPPEAADYLCVPVQTLAQWRWRGIGPKSIKVGRHIRYRWSDIEKWLDRQSAGGDAA
jgi:predicted DNA-binding transcriptional regulator AlpA